MQKKYLVLAGMLAVAGGSSVADAVTVQNYESFSEGFLGTSFSAGGVSYRDVNPFSGSFPDGGTFDPEDLGNQLIIEDATLFFDDFPTYGSADKVLTFGSAFVPGNNLSIGALSSVFMDLDSVSDFASLDLAFYENGPWGGIEYHLDGLLGNTIVASDSFAIANGGGRDNPTWRTMSISGANFDTLHLYATWNGGYSGPRGMIDNLTLNPVPEPATLAVVGFGAAALIKRRRRRA